MTILYDQLSEADYKTKRYSTLLQFEESGVVKLTAYPDNPNGGYATIGAGFKIDSNWDAILEAFRFDLSNPTDIAYRQQLTDLVGTDKKYTTGHCFV